MKKINWSAIRLVLIFGLVVFLYAFTSDRNVQRKLKKSEVVFLHKDNLFIDYETVNNLLIENQISVQNITKDALDLDKLEKSLKKHDMILDANVYVSVDGVLKAVVKQKTPIGRVFDGFGSFYIDYEGNRMPLSSNYTARIPIVLGDFQNIETEKLAEVLRKINDDSFLKSNIIGIQILSNGNLIMSNRNYDFEIEFGKTINIERKFKNYKAFYQKAILDNTLENYKKINLKFTQQVVCTK